MYVSFTANAGKLERVVARNINNARRELIEDAYANAWAILLRRADITLDAHGFSWLTTVAINEALALLRRTRGETPVGTFQAHARGHDDTDVPEPADSDAPGADERALELIEHTERVQAFRMLKPREREALYLKALGHSDTEICRSRTPRIRPSTAVSAKAAPHCTAGSPIANRRGIRRGRGAASPRLEGQCP